LLALAALPAAIPQSGGPIDVGARRQLFLDDFWFDSKKDVTLQFHPAVPGEVVLRCDRPWEKKIMHYSSVIDDGGKFRMYYRVDEGDPNVDVNTDQTWTCYAESRDGVRWEKPNLGLVRYKGSTANNILGGKTDLFNLSVIIDPNERPGSPRRYKMISRIGGIRAYVSGDGLRWTAVQTNPILRPEQGPFDSHNVLLWDDEARRFVIYLRGIDSAVAGSFKGGRRAIRRSESADFLHWSKPELVVTADERDPADYHFYTNAAVKYERAARSFFMFPMILYSERQYPGTRIPGVSDVHFATSRDGVRWSRHFREPFVGPDADPRNWVDRNPIVGQGILPTGPNQLSLYYSELFRAPESRIRRATLRTDGFVSVRGPYAGWGEFTTRAVKFSGRRLELNYRTTGGGSLQVELQDEAGRALDGFKLEDCPEMFGDKVEGFARWRKGEDVSALAGKPVRLRVRLRDADLYAFRFAPQ
jgi:hypothetical protein